MNGRGNGLERGERHRSDGPVGIHFTATNIGSGIAELVSRSTDFRLHYLELKMKFLTAANVAEVKLPKFARETKRRPLLIEVCDQL